MAFSQMSETIKIFFSLAPEDRNLFKKLRKHLSSLKRQGLIDMWYDSEISAGSNVGEIIKAYMSTADIIVLLISADFFDSDQCVEVEMPYALEQYVSRAAQVIPVLLRPTEWGGFSLERHSPLPSDGTPVSSWHNVDIALAEVAKGIRRVVESLVSRLIGMRTLAKPPQFPLYTIPDRPNPFFTDREDVFQALHHSFTSEQSGQIRTQALHGLGGMGKTIIAMEYARRYQHEYQDVLWLNATPPELLSANIISLADQLGIPGQDDVDEQERFTAIRHWLKHHEKWLVILDNLEDFTLLDQLIPLQGSGHVLFITHSQATGQFASAVPVMQMSIEEGALLLLRRAKIIPKQGTREVASEDDYLQARAIAQEVEGYPLALDQAGAYIEETQRSLASYLNLYHERQASLLGKRGRLASDHPDPVTTTLTLTFQKIAQMDPHALELLRFFAFLHPDALPDEMLLHGASSLTGPLRTLAADPIVLDAAIATLQRFSLVQRRADSTTLNMHRIVQVVIKKDMPKKQQIQLANQAVRLINYTFPEVHFTTWKGCERYVPQAVYCATLLHDLQLTLQEGPLLLERLGAYYYQRGCYTEAETYLTQALDLQEHYLHTNPAETAQTLNSLGLLYQRQARYQEAEELHQRALELRERVLGPDHPQTAESLHNLAGLYENNGQYDQAEQIYLRVLSLDERTAGSDYSETAKTLNNLGLVYYLQGNYSQAESMYQRVLTLYENSLSPDHPDLTYTLNGLGALAEKRGNYQQAEKLYQRALVIRQQTFGDEHPETAHSINKLADIAESLGHYQQAETLYQQALAIGEKTLGSEHPDVALFLNNLAFLAAKQAQYQQAKSLYQRALNIYEQALGLEHPIIARVLNNLGQLAHNTKNEAQAEALLKRALTIREQVLGITHPDTAQSMSILADLLTDQHRYEEAETLFQQALTIHLQTSGPEHPDLARIREKYASLLEHMQRSEEATRLQQIAPEQDGGQAPESLK